MQEAQEPHPPSLSKGNARITVDSDTTVVQSQLRNGCPQGDVAGLFHRVNTSKDLEGTKVNIVKILNLFS